MDGSEFSYADVQFVAGYVEDPGDGVLGVVDILGGRVDLELAFLAWQDQARLGLHVEVILRSDLELTADSLALSEGCNKKQNQVKTKLYFLKINKPLLVNCILIGY